jgi:hypothetical protein
MKAIIYRAEHGGLANRLRALVGYQTMSHFLTIPFYLWWVPNDSCDADFAHLFDSPDIKLLTAAEWNVLRGDGEVSIFQGYNWFDKIWKTHMEDRLPWPVFARQAIYFLGRLSPKMHILEKIEEFSKLHHLQDAIGVHIRHTDNLSAYKFWTERSTEFNPEYISRLEGFKGYIESRISSEPSLRVLLATDNKKIEKNFRELYGRHVITFDKKYRNGRLKFSLRGLKFTVRGRTSSIEDALIEMFLLSKCRAILGTYYSSFSKFSAVLGNTEYFEVRGSDYVRNEFIESLKQFTDRDE